MTAQEKDAAGPWMAGRRRLPIWLMPGLAGAIAFCGACHPSPVELPAASRPTTIEPERPAVGRFARVLLATWTEEQQKQLAVAALRGVAVFAAAGTDLRLLPGCRIEGRYRYLGVVPRQQHVALADDAQVRVNLALGSGAPTPRSPLTLDLVYVGTLATTRRAAKDAALEGSCDGATHFARTLSIGETGSDAAGIDRRAGCATASANDRGPPQQCQRFLRAELIGLRGATYDTADGAISFCPSGWALAGDVCVSRASAPPYECLDEPGDCRAQCDRGSAPSCTRLGYLLAHGEAGFVRDDRQALTLYERACAAGYPPACFNIGVLHWSGDSVPKDEARAERYWDRACAAGYAAACSNLGVLNVQARSRPVDRERALASFARACAAGDPHACLDEVHVMVGGERLPADPAAGPLLTAACDGDVADGCLDLSIWLTHHGGAPDLVKGLVDKACRLGARKACVLSSPTEGI